MSTVRKPSHISEAPIEISPEVLGTSLQKKIPRLTVTQMCGDTQAGHLTMKIQLEKEMSPEGVAIEISPPDVENPHETTIDKMVGDVHGTNNKAKLSKSPAATNTRKEPLIV